MASTSLAAYRVEYLTCRARGHGWIHLGGIPMKWNNIRYIEYKDECHSCGGWRKFSINPRTGENVVGREDWRPEDYKLDARYTKAECMAELNSRGKTVTAVVHPKFSGLRAVNA